MVYELNNWPLNPTNNLPLKIAYLVHSNWQETQSKVNLFLMVEEYHFMEKVHGVLVITLQEML